MKTSNILITKPSSDYELVDSGEGEKLERFGKILMSRPDPQALWPKRLPESEWKKADAYFTRDSDKAEWTFREAGTVPAEWPIEFAGLKFLIKPTAFKHTGLFPEQAPNWEWMRELINGAVKDKREIEVLNLFGYTGGASLACAQAGAKVVHIDSSKSAVAWARQNAELSGLVDKINAGQVKKIEVQENNLTITVNDDTQLKSEKENSTALRIFCR
ncbi:MAG: class I SAM-dependent methyltransferase [Candidatus Taylorbacteria bacterium]|nr:class I SAM-dependent methyltransferase [Candidatus Taylorbacteria bacterium]